MIKNKFRYFPAFLSIALLAIFPGCYTQLAVTQDEPAVVDSRETYYYPPDQPVVVVAQPVIVICDPMPPNMPPGHAIVGTPSQPASTESRREIGYQRSDPGNSSNQNNTGQRTTGSGRGGK